MTNNIELPHNRLITALITAAENRTDFSESLYQIHREDRAKVFEALLKAARSVHIEDDNRQTKWSPRANVAIPLTQEIQGVIDSLGLEEDRPPDLTIDKRPRGYKTFLRITSPYKLVDLHGLRNPRLDTVTDSDEAIFEPSCDLARALADSIDDQVDFTRIFIQVPEKYRPKLYATLLNALLVDVAAREKKIEELNSIPGQDNVIEFPKERKRKWRQP